MNHEKLNRIDKKRKQDIEYRKKRQKERYYSKIKVYKLNNGFKVRAISEKQAWFLYYNKTISKDKKHVGIIHTQLV